MTRWIALPVHLRTYLALGVVSAVAFFCAHHLFLVTGVAVLFGGLGAVWLLGRTRISAGEESVSVREFGFLGGAEHIEYSAITAVRTRAEQGPDESDDTVVLELQLAGGELVRVGPWQSFFRRELIRHVDEVAGEIRLRRARGAEHGSRVPMPSVA